MREDFGDALVTHGTGDCPLYYGTGNAADRGAGEDSVDAPVARGIGDNSGDAPVARGTGDGSCCCSTDDESGRGTGEGSGLTPVDGGDGLYHTSKPRGP